MHRARTILLASLLAIGASHAVKADSPDEIKVGLFVTGLHDVDFAASDAKAHFWAWFIHNNPDWKIADSIELPTAKSSRIVNTVRETYDGVVWDQAKYEATLIQSWSIEYYPFDRQTVQIALESADREAGRLRFVPDVADSKLNPGLRLDDWNLSNFRIRSVDHTYPSMYGDPRERGDGSSSYSRIVVEFDMKRAGWRIFLNNFIGLLFSILLSGIVIVSNSSRHLSETLQMTNQIGIGTGAVFAAVGAAYILQTKLPVTSQFTMADAIEATAFVAALLCLLSAIVTNALVRLERIRGAAIVARVFLGLYLAMIGGDIFLLSKAVRI